MRTAFGGEVLKELLIPGLIDMYNHHMNGVDLADWMRGSYSMKHHTNHTWIPIFRYLIKTAIANTLKLWVSMGLAKTKESGHYCFREAYAYTLVRYGPRLAPYRKQWSTKYSNISVKVVAQNIISCAICLGDRRKTSRPARKPLNELSSNSLCGKGELRLAKKNTPRNLLWSLNL